MVATGYGNLPPFADGQPQAFWNAVDTYERKNGRAYKEIEIALPNELTHEEKHELTKHFIQSEIGGHLPYAYAIHDKPAALDPEQRQPHAHIMVSERIYDEIPRSAETYFKRPNKKSPAIGGPGKDRNWSKRDKIYDLRKRWEIIQNDYLKEKGIESRVDSRSHADIRKEAREKNDAAYDELYDRPPIGRVNPKILRMSDSERLKDNERFIQREQLKRQKQLKKIKEMIHRFRREAGKDRILTTNEARHEINKQLKSMGFTQMQVDKRLSDLRRRQKSLERASTEEAVLSATYNKMTRGKYKKERAQYARSKKEYEKLLQREKQDQLSAEEQKALEQRKTELKKAAAESIKRIKDMEKRASEGKARYKRDAIRDAIRENTQKRAHSVYEGIGALEKEAERMEKDRVVLVQMKGELWPQRGDKKINYSRLFREKSEPKPRGRLHVKLYEREEDLER